jgi:hypothetical protein
MDKMFWKITKLSNGKSNPVVRREYKPLPEVLRDVAERLEIAEGLAAPIRIDKVIVERTSEAEYRQHVHPRFKGM